MAPASGREYPGSYGEFLAWFRGDGDCLDYLDWLRWRDGFTCPACGGDRAWELRVGRRECTACGRQSSVTAGTIFHKSRTPLTVWFAAAWLLTSQKSGASALGLQRVLGIGSYQTAWAMLHRLRSAMVRPGRDRLSGMVEMDETLLGGVRPGGKGGRTPGEKILVGVAIERRQPRGFGRGRLAVLPDASTESLKAFLTAHVEPGSTVVTDGWQPYKGALQGAYGHERYVAPGRLAHELLPGVHRVASLLDRWLLSTHQGAVEGDHVQGYLDEFSFRFNRRSSRARGMLFYRLLEQAVASEPVTYRSMVVNPKSRTSTPGGRRRAHYATATLALPPAERPWRQPAETSSNLT